MLIYLSIVLFQQQNMYNVCNTTCISLYSHFKNTGTNLMTQHLIYFFMFNNYSPFSLNQSYVLELIDRLVDDIQKFRPQNHTA